MDKKDLSFLSNREYKLKGKLPQENEIKIINKKELAIQHFKSKYNCKWEEVHDNLIYNEDLICITHYNKAWNNNEYINIRIELKPSDKNFFAIWCSNDDCDDDYNDHCSVEVSFEMLEDLLSILHLYYMKKGE